MNSPRYVVGIDLGTTHAAMAFADLEDASPQPAIRVLEIPQTVRPGESSALPLLPACIYLPDDGELPEGSLALPWDEREPRTASGIAYTIGEFAKTRGGEVPGRLISSAKSWLSQPGPENRRALLPWNAPPGVPELTPVEASALILKHLAQTWSYAMRHDARAGSLKDQAVVLCVPASFEAAARELTLEAAHRAGLGDVALLEEPQAAFYAWLEQFNDTWREQARVGDLILVVDVGGGTTDFSLIAVEDDNGALALRRIAVGEHILLGGDNMDLALARAAATRLQEERVRLDEWQLRGLALACCAAKEQLLSGRTPAAPEKVSVAVLGRGAEVIGSAVTTSLSRTEAESLILEGFLPKCEPSSKPRKAARPGLREMGLAYAADPAITKHLARFLANDDSGYLLLQESGGDGALKSRPTQILFNGGVMKSAVLRNRIVEVVADWVKRDGGSPPRALWGNDLELAVARGAAFYGLVRRGKGVRIRGGIPRSYYMAIESSAPAVPGGTPAVKALCVVPFGMEEGTELEVPGATFGLVIGEPAQFRFFSSTTRRSDRIGDAIETLDALQELEPIETMLPPTLFDAPGTVVPIRLKSRITPEGMLELWCEETDGAGRWKLELNISAPG